MIPNDLTEEYSSRFRRKSPFSFDFSEVWARHWASATLLIVASVHLVWIIPRLVPPGVGIGPDAAVFEYSGWYMTHGAVPYVDVWDIKPPLVFLLTAGLAAVFGHSSLLYHQASILITAAASIGSILLVGLLVYDLTDDHLASSASSLTALALPVFYTLPSNGVRPKYFTLFFGLLSVYVYSRDMKMASGMAAAASAGFWQFGVVFPAIVFGMVLRDRNIRDGLRLVGGMAILTSLVLLPLVVRGAVWDMVGQVVLVPAIDTEPNGLSNRIDKATRMLGPAHLVALAGMIGAALACVFDRDAWWITAGALGFTAHVFHFDFDGSPDLIPWFVFVSLGVGILFSAADSDRLEAIGGSAQIRAISLVALVGVVVVSSPFVGDPVLVGTDFPSSPVVVDLQTMFWDQTAPDSCYVRQSADHRMWVKYRDAVGMGLCDRASPSSFLRVIG